MIVYFSRRGQNLYRGPQPYLNVGNTELIAKAVVNRFPQPVLAEIVPVHPYPNDYQEALAVAKQELADRTLPAIKPLTADIAGSQHIILAFPKWWNHLPRPVVTFMKQFQWQNKTIYPVCTHEENRFGDILNELAELAQGSTIERGLAIRGVCASDADRAVENWLNNYDQDAAEQPLGMTAYWQTQPGK
ncbi:flavodoxin [Lacticaseibacillus porcinae]|uniref:flavodoxin n=1 Tax=Lacticaseibacillus porcinae TaxID=1123687 RepID=UPI000F77C217|nr:hypothetical protein [Lacticaseibacillus porcinae]